MKFEGNFISNNNTCITLTSLVRLHIHYYFTDNRTCAKTTSPNTCLRIEQDTFVGFGVTKNWYQAHDECQKIGATLAVIDSQYKVKKLLWDMKYWFKTYDLMHIGLIHDKWVPINNKIG